MNSFLTNHHNSRAYAILFTWIKVITLFDYCGIDIQPVKFGTQNAPQFDIDPKCKLNRALSSTSEEEQLKNTDTTSVVVSGSGTTDMSSSFFRTTELTFVVSLFFSCSFFQFSSETLEWHSINTFVITPSRIDASRGRALKTGPSL